MKAMRPASEPSRLLLMSAMGQGILLASAPVLARSMGPEDRGIYYPLLAMVAIFSALAVMGAPQQLRIKILKNESIKNEVFQALIIYVAIGLGVLVLANFSLNPAGEFHAMIFTLVVIWALSALQSILSSILLASRDYKHLGLIQPIVPSVHALLALLVLVLDLSASKYLLLFHLLGLLTAILVSALFAAPSLKNAGQSSNPDKTFWSRSARSFSPNLSLALFSRLDLVIVAAIYGPSDAGIYSIAVTATAALMVLYEPISGHLYAFFHNSSRGRTDTQQAETHQILSRWFSVVFTASLIVAVTWFFALEPIFGADFSPAAWLAVALSASSAFAVLASITSDLVIARGKPGASLRASSLGFVLFWVVLIFSYRVPLVGVIASLFAWYFSTTLLNLQALEVNPLKLRWSPALSVQGFRELLRVGRR